MNPRRKENLKPFKKGQSGNPKGRPKKLPQLDKLLDEVMGQDVAGKSVAMQIIAALAKKAKRGDVKAAEVLLDRAYGKAKTPISADVTVNQPMSDAQVDKIINSLRENKAT